MKIIIIGAGELGRNLAAALCDQQHDVVIIDASKRVINTLRDDIDAMFISGNGIKFQTLRDADVGHADMLIAISGDEPSNILSCQIARHFGVKNTICRLYSNDFFSSDDGFLPSDIGVSKVVIPEEECVRKIMNIVNRHIVLEKIIFSVKDAEMVSFRVEKDSPIANIRLKDFPAPELMQSIRLSAIVRRKKMIVPKGETKILVNDEIYIAGRADSVEAMLNWVDPENRPVSRIIVAGATRIGFSLSNHFCKAHFDVRLIEANLTKCEKILNDSYEHLVVLNGDSTRKNILQEAGISECDVFISAHDSDEDNILSCILAKKSGAKKVITVTNKKEYVEIVPELDMIDAGFNSGMVAVNTILRHLGTGVGQLNIDAILQRINANIYEFKVEKGSRVCDKKIMEIKFPEDTILALVFRNGEVLTPYGNLTLLENDIVATLATEETQPVLIPYFKNLSFLFG